jgi:biopolymer transport protein ExbD
MLLRAGRPLPEVESAVAQASQREADKLYANVRWLNLAASLATMLGLIGTIQGMIIAFHRLTIMDAAADRTTVLADGIYTALVTTFAGLAVAIPALLASHYFEGRILTFFRQIDELVFNLLPQLERYEGRVRFGRQAEPGEIAAGDEPARVEAELTERSSAVPVQSNKGRAVGLLDMTPMMDMVFNLLIFFMVVSQFAQEERDLKVQLPDGSEAMPLTVKPREIFVNIDKDGRYFVRSQQVGQEELSHLLAQAALNNPASQSVIIRADKRAAWDYVAMAMRLCNQAGIRDYSASLADEP